MIIDHVCIKHDVIKLMFMFYVYMIIIQSFILFLILFCVTTRSTINITTRWKVNCRNIKEKKKVMLLNFYSYNFYVINVMFMFITYNINIMFNVYIVMLSLMLCYVIVIRWL
jgi:hypothetical protein